MLSTTLCDCASIDESSMTVIDELFSVATKLNNIGVDLLLEHEDEQASTTFHKAIESMKIVVGFKTRQSRGDYSCSGVSEHLLECQEILTDASSLTCQSSRKGSKDQREITKKLLPEEDNNDMVYTQPMKIIFSENHCRCEDNEGTGTDDKKGIAIILYNTALSYQIRGIKNGERGILVKSLKMYNMAFQSISDALYEVPRSGLCTHKRKRRESVLLLLLASLNNAAFIYDRDGRHDDANGLFHSLLEITHMIPADDTQDSTVEYFVMNAITHQIPCAAPSA